MLFFLRKFFFRLSVTLVFFLQVEFTIFPFELLCYSSKYLYQGLVDRHTSLC